MYTAQIALFTHCAIVTVHDYETGGYVGDGPAIKGKPQQTAKSAIAWCKADESIKSYEVVREDF